MTAFRYVVTVRTDTEAHADQVMGERLGHDEEYQDEGGATFDYQVPYARLSTDAYRALCGLVQSGDDVPVQAIVADPTVWDELRRTFPIADARLECTNCGETYREGDHVIADRDPGLCLTCAVGG